MPRERDRNDRWHRVSNAGLQLAAGPGIFRGMNLREMKIAVVGSGAVGCYYGGLLAHAGFDVRFLMRADLAAVRARGLTIHTQGKTVAVPRVTACATTAEIGPEIGRASCRERV